MRETGTAILSERRLGWLFLCHRSPISSWKCSGTLHRVTKPFKLYGLSQNVSSANFRQMTPSFLFFPSNANVSSRRGILHLITKSTEEGWYVQDMPAVREPVQSEREQTEVLLDGVLPGMAYGSGQRSREDEEETAAEIAAAICARGYHTGEIPAQTGPVAGGKVDFRTNVTCTGS